MSANIKYQWDLAQKHLDVPDLSLTAGELGRLNLSLAFGEITPGLPAAMRAELSHATLHYSDNSLVDRMMKANAARAGTAPAAYRQQLVDSIAARAAAFADDATLQALAKEVIAFLNAPQSLSVEVAPPKPVPMLTLLRAATMPAPTVAAMLGLSAAANR